MTPCLSPPVLGRVYVWQKQHEQALAEPSGPSPLIPTMPTAIGILGNILAFAGRPEEGDRGDQEGMRLNPRYQSS